MADDPAAAAVAAWPQIVPAVVRRLAGFARLVGAEWDDLVQAGWVGFVDAARRYDPARGLALNTWLTELTRQAVMLELRRASGRGFSGVVDWHGPLAPPPRPLRLDLPLPGADGRPIGDLVPDRRAGPAAAWSDGEWAAVLARLAPRQRKLVELKYRRGLTPAELRAVLGIKGQALGDLKARACGRLRGCPELAEYRPD